LKIKITAARMQKSSDATKTTTCTSIPDLTTQSTLGPNSQGANSLEKRGKKASSGTIPHH